MPPPQSVTLDNLQDDKLLKPVIADDAMILAIDELDIDQQPADAQEVAATSSQKSLQEVNVRLAEELEAVKSQFANFRIAVEQTLDKRWADESVTPSAPVSDKPSDPSHYYWESYATNGEIFWPCPSNIGWYTTPGLW